MIIQEFTDQERCDLKVIEGKIVSLIKINERSEPIFDYLLTCSRWTSQRVVIFASMIAGGLRETQKNLHGL